jgi:hypothetical protein
MYKREHGVIIKKLGRILAVALVCLSLAMKAHGEERPVNEVSVRALLDAKDQKSLDQVFSKAAREDEALKAVYRNRRLVLNPGSEEELRFLEGLPATEEGLWRVYQLTHPSDSKLGEDPRISNVVYGMFERAAHYAQKHGKGHRQVLQLCLFSDGELAETAWEWCGWLLHEDSAKTLAAIQSLPAKDQQRMCSGEKAEGFTVKDAMQKCITGL